MKKLIIVISLALAIAMLDSCQKSDTQVPRVSRLVAVTEALNTKSTVEIDGNNANFRWAEADAISVFTTANNFAKYIFADKEFINNDGVTPQIAAIYPYNSNYTNANITDGKIVKVILPNTYNYSDASNSNMAMISYLEEDKLSFKHIGGVAMFPIKNVPKNASTFIFKANDNITGEFDIIQPSGDDTHNGTIALDGGQGDGTTVTISNIPSGDMVDFYIPLPCGDYAGFELIIKDESDIEIAHVVSKKHFTITRASVKLFEGLDCDKAPHHFANEKDAVIALYKAVGRDDLAESMKDIPLEECEGIGTNAEGKVISIKVKPTNGNLSSDILGTFTELTYLVLYPYKNKLIGDFKVDLSKNPKLTDLEFGYLDFPNLDVSKNIELIDLYCPGNGIESIDLSANINLKSIDVSQNKLSSLDISNCTQLEYLHCSENNLSSLDVSKNTELRSLYFFTNQIESINLNANANLEELYFWENNLSSLDLSNCTKLNSLWCGDNAIESIDLSVNINLEVLWIENNNLSSLDVSKNTKLQSLLCFDNNLSSLDVSNCTQLTELRCENNNLSSLDVSDCSELEILDCYNNYLNELNILNLFNLWYLNCGNQKDDITNTLICYDAWYYGCWLSYLIEYEENVRVEVDKDHEWPFPIEE